MLVNYSSVLENLKKIKTLLIINCINNGFNKKIKLKYICNCFTSQITEQSVFKYPSGPYCIYGASGIIKTINFFKIFRKAIAVVKDGAGIGHVYFMTGKTSTLSTLVSLVPCHNIDPRWLYYVMQSISFESQDAVTIPHIYFSVYGDVKVPDIPLSDQQKIARYLDEKIKYLDEKIKYTLSLKESLEKLKLCLIKKTIDIDPTKSCIKTKIKYISNFIQATKFPYNKTIYPNNNSEHNIAIVTAGKTFIYGYGEKQTYPSFNKPAILFDDFTSECKFIDIPFYFPSSAGKIIINNNKSDIKWLYYVIQSLSGMIDIKDHGRHWIDIYQNISIPFISLPEQQEKVKYLNKKILKINSWIKMLGGK